MHKLDLASALPPQHRYVLLAVFDVHIHGAGIQSDLLMCVSTKGKEVLAWKYSFFSLKLTGPEAGTANIRDQRMG